MKSKLCFSYFSLSKPIAFHQKPAPKPPFSLKDSVESLLLSRHSVGSKSDAEKGQAEVTDKEKEKEREQIILMYPIESLFRTIIQSEAIATQSEETHETDEEKSTVLYSI
jgi:hypothetical protein